MKPDSSVKPIGTLRKWWRRLLSRMQPPPADDNGGLIYRIVDKPKDKNDR